MKTQDLVRQLARSAAAVDAREVRRRFWVPLASAVPVAVLLVLATVGLRADWREAIVLPMFWVKLAFPALAAIAGAGLLGRLGRPGARTQAAAVLLAMPFLLVGMMAASVLTSADPAERAHLVLGNSWLQCVVSITALSVPAFALSVHAVRSLAPTRLPLTGFVAGLVAGAVAALAYALYCDEMQAPFLAVWYVLGMSVPAVCGSLAGPRLLRW